MCHRKPNVLFVTHSLEGSGAPRSLQNMIFSIKKHIAGMIFCTCSRRESNALTFDCVVKNILLGNALTTVNVAGLVRILKIIPKIVFFSISNLLALLQLVFLIKKHKIDIVHTNTSVVAAGFFAAKLCRIKHVWHLREYIYKGQRCYPIFGFCFLRYLISKSDAVIPITYGIKEFYKTHFEPMYDAVFCIKNILAENDLKKDYILFCGSLEENKQPETALLAFGKISKDYPSLRLKLAGTGDLEDKLRLLAKDLKIDSKVDFLGYVNKPYPLFNSAKAFLMTSKFEGMGRTTIEAMANDCVVIGYNNGGTAEIIKHGETGFLYNNEDEFLKYLKYVLDSKDNCKTIRASAKKWALENASEEKYGEKIMAIYNKLLGNIK